MRADLAELNVALEAEVGALDRGFSAQGEPWSRFRFGPRPLTFTYPFWPLYGYPIGGMIGRSYNQDYNHHGKGIKMNDRMKLLAVVLSALLATACSKEEASSNADAAMDQASEVVEEAAEAAGDALDAAGAAAGEAIDGAAEMADDAMDGAAEMADNAMDHASDAVDEAAEEVTGDQ